MRMGGLVLFSSVNLIKTMWLTPRNMNFGLLVHELWSENPWFLTIAIYYREKRRPYFGRSSCDLEVFFISNFLIFPHKTSHVRLVKHKKCNLVPRFCAMFDRKVLDPLRVHNFGLFLISVKKLPIFPKI